MSRIINNEWEDYLYDEYEADLRGFMQMKRRRLHAASAVASIASMAMSTGKYKGRKPGAKTKKRVRLDVNKAFCAMDDRHFRRKYRMDKDSFYNLLDIIKEHLPNTGEKRKRGSVPNGAITHAARLSMALRVAAGGDVLDIADYHGVGEDEPMESFWIVVDAINDTKQLDIVFPESHEEQKHLAAGFKRKSEIDIPCCIGALDGILIWIHKPTTSDCGGERGVGPGKFMCGRKKKFGLNMQAICDSKRRFIWVDIRFPGATSDYFAFEQSELFQKLQTREFLHPGLCIFGDAAYVNSSFMCVPYRNVHGSDGSKDVFNFFQSQLRITIECAFGMLVHRFGILRKPFPVNVSVRKTSAAVLALCKLHNFCIDSNNDHICQSDIADSGNIVLDGGMTLPRIDNADGNYYWHYNANLDRVDGLLDGGSSLKGVSEYARSLFKAKRDWPVHQIHNYVRQSGSRRPERNNLRRRSA